MNSGTARHGTLLLSAFCRFPRRARLCPRKSRRHSESGRRSGRDLKHASEANYVTQRNGADVRLGGVLVWWRRPRKPSRWGTLPETPMPRGRGRGRGGKRSSPGIASAACFSTCARTILGSGAGGGGGARHARLKGNNLDFGLRSRGLRGRDSGKDRCQAVGSCPSDWRYFSARSLGTVHVPRCCPQHGLKM